MARIPKHEIERLKAEVSVAAAGGGARDQARTPRSGPDRPVPFSRRSRAVACDHAGEEPVALPGRMPDGRIGDRLGDEEPRA